mgnify:CR=1 FL=1
MTFEDWLTKTKNLLELTEIDTIDLVVFEDYFEQGLTPHSAAYEYTIRRNYI